VDAAAPPPVAEDGEPEGSFQGTFDSQTAFKKPCTAAVFRGIVRPSISFARNYW
jgi:hypothetical protein